MKHRAYYYYFPSILRLFRNNRAETQPSIRSLPSKPSSQSQPQPVKPLISALLGERQATPPLWLMRQAGRYLPEYRRLRAKAENFIGFCHTPELAAEATLQPLRRFPLDAAILFSDILVVPHALGQSVWFEEGAGPRLEPISGPRDMDGLQLAGLGERLAAVYRTVSRVRTALTAEGKDHTALIGFAGAPWTVATYMVEGGSSRDFARTKAWAYGDPDGFQALIDLLVEATAEHLICQVAAGAEVVQLFDSWAGVLPESQFERWVTAPTRAIVARLKARCPSVPIIGFPRGAGPMYRSYRVDSGVDVLGLDTSVPLDWAARELQRLGPVQGNLDPHLLVAGGVALEAEVRRILEAFANRPFVFNLGHGILPETPPENVAALARLVHGWTG